MRRSSRPPAISEAATAGSSCTSGATYTQFVYDPLGEKLGIMNGQTVSRLRVPLPGGGFAIYGAGGALLRYWHADGLGNIRLYSNPNPPSFYGDTAFAPFGEAYAGSTTPGGIFAGLPADTVYNGSVLGDALQGRWLSPDPAGLAAVDDTNPQSLNRYAYVMNSPTTFIDPTGLYHCIGGSPCVAANFGNQPNPINFAGGEGGILEGGSWDTIPWDENGDPTTADVWDGFYIFNESADSQSGIAVLPLPSFKYLLALVPPCTPQSAAFVSANAAYANQIAQGTRISATNLLGLSALESNFGTSNMALNQNNYFGLTVGHAFKGTVTTYTTADGRNFGVYPSPGFLTSGLSFAQSFQGSRVTGVTDPAAFAARLTTPPLAFNSEAGYSNKLILRIAQVSACTR
jgi:RHS repeat-associated protein